jgi:alkylhydroperoxidase family enzyme
MIKMRMNVAATAPEVYKHLMQLEELVAAKIEPRLLHLLKLRASQINGCA